MEEYLKEVKMITDSLAVSNAVVQDEDVVLFILNILSSEYSALSSYVRARPTPISVQDLNDLLTSEEIHVLKFSNPSGLSSDFNPAMALQAATPQFSPQAPRGVYDYRGKGNFRGVRNFREGYRARRRKIQPSTSCQIRGRQNHATFECYYRLDPRYQPSSSRGLSSQALMATSSTSVPTQQWFFDSGATHHITSDLNSLSTYDNYNGQDSISVGNGSTVPIQNTGSGQVFEENTLPRTH